MEWSRVYALEEDKQDILASFKEEFYKNEQEIYFDGNSLGLLSKRAESSLLAFLQSWKTYGINGWMNGEHPWFYFSEKLATMSCSLVGAKEEEISITGSITTNLHQLIATFYNPIGNRTKILTDDLTFPSDVYAIQSQLLLKGFQPNEHLIQVKSHDGQILLEEDIIAAMTDDIALVILPSVLYRSGQVLDIKRLTFEAHTRGILIGFDLAHSIGSLPHCLHDWEVDFAVWCNYKHIGAGPGAVGGLFVHERHFPIMPGLRGWFGSNKEKQFDMSHVFTPSQTAGALQIGTPHILSMAPLYGSLQIFQEAGIEAIRNKSLQLTDFLLLGIHKELSMYNFGICNPIEHSKRGGHVYIEHPDAARICKALKERGVIPDFRAPKGIRIAPVALYNTFEEVWNMIHILKEIMQTKSYLQYENVREVIA